MDEYTKCWTIRIWFFVVLLFHFGYYTKYFGLHFNLVLFSALVPKYFQSNWVNTYLMPWCWVPSERLSWWGIKKEESSTVPRTMSYEWIDFFRVIKMIIDRRVIFILNENYGIFIFLLFFKRKFPMRIQIAFCVQCSLLQFEEMNMTMMAECECLQIVKASIQPTTKHINS